MHRGSFRRCGSNYATSTRGRLRISRCEDIVFLSVLRDGELVGRTTAHRHARLEARLGAPHLLFGFTEFIDDRDVFAAIAAELASRAIAARRSGGCSGR